MTDDPARPPDATSHLGNEVPLESSRMSFGDHLDELRSCLIRAIVGVVLATILALFFGREILQIICLPLLVVQHANGLPPHLQVLAPTAAFTAFLRIGFLSGLIVAMPWVLYQGWRFVSTGLYPHERRFTRLLVPSSLGLFVLGVLFLYCVVLPIVLHFFIRFNQNFAAPDLTRGALQRLLLPEEPPPPPATGSSELGQITILQKDPLKPKDGDVWVNAGLRRLMVKTSSGVLSMPLERGATTPSMQSQFAIDFYVTFVLTLALAFGIAFETPIVVFFLAWTGIVSRAAMVRGRRYVILATVVAAAILTPPDVISQILLAGPMYLLFELGMFVARLTEQRAEASA